MTPAMAPGLTEPPQSIAELMQKPDRPDMGRGNDEAFYLSDDEAQSRILIAQLIAEAEKRIDEAIVKPKD